MKTLGFLLLITVLLTTGCESGPSYRVNIISDPPGAVIKIAANDSAMGKRSLTTPHSKTLRFSDRTPQFRIEALPAGNLAETHLVTEMVITEADLTPSEGSKPQELTIHLKTRPWIDMRSYELVYDPDLGWRGFETKDRAYTNTRESNNLRVDDIASIYSSEDDDDYDGFRGVRLSSGGDNLVFATFKLDPPEVMPTRNELKLLEKDDEDISKFVPRMEWLHPIKYSHIRTQYVKGRANDYPLKSGTNFDPALIHNGEGLLFAFDSTGEGDSQIQERPKINGAINMNLTNHFPGEGVCYPSHIADKDDPSKHHYIFTLFPSDWETLDDPKLKILSDTYNQIIDIGIGMHPMLSPDRKKIAHIRNGNLYVIGSGGTGLTGYTTNAKKIIRRYAETVQDSPEDLARWENYERDRLFLPNSYPTWSPDGKWLLFTSYSISDQEGKPQQDIFAIDVQTGKNLIQLTTNQSADRMPMISPDGKTFFFVSNRGKKWAVWKMSLPERMWPR